MSTVIEAIRSRLRHLQHDDPAPKVVLGPPPPPPPPHKTIDLALRDACRNAASNDRILYLGMNETSTQAEIKALGPDVTAVTTSTKTAVSLGGTDYGLEDPAGVHTFAKAFVATFGLSDNQRAALEQVLLYSGQDAHARDEIARIAIAWAPGEHGGTIPSRLVLSGHSAFGQLWGDDTKTGMLRFAAIRELGKVLPRAAQQIEDLHFAGCSTEEQVQFAGEWVVAFPNLKSIWGYGGASPLAPTDHLAAWEHATRGRNDHFDKSILLERAPATAWTSRNGIVSETVSLVQRRRLANDADERFEDYLSGRTRIIHPHDARPEADCRAYQQLAAHAATTPSERTTATQHAEKMLRLRYWEQGVRRDIAAKFGSEIQSAFTKAGLPTIDIATMTRKETVDALKAYETKVGSLPHPLDAISTLDPMVIEPDWCRQLITQPPATSGR